MFAAYFKIALKHCRTDHLTISGPKIRGSKISNPAVDIHDCVALGYAVKSVPEFRLRSFKG